LATMEHDSKKKLAPRERNCSNLRKPRTHKTENHSTSLPLKNEGPKKRGQRFKKKWRRESGSWGKFRLPPRRNRHNDPGRKLENLKERRKSLVKGGEGRTSRGWGVHGITIVGKKK